jgi:hypothetical protein
MKARALNEIVYLVPKYLSDDAMCRKCVAAVDSGTSSTVEAHGFSRAKKARKTWALARVALAIGN